MSGMELLKNTGIQFIGNEKALQEDRKTIIVLGVARGGTSLVAGILDHLGIYGGERSVKPVFEDLNLAEAFEKNNKEEAINIINQYNNNGIWYFKRPGALDYTDQLDEKCVNPIYLIIFKDIFAVSNRNNISMKTDVVMGLQKAYDDYGKLLKFISTNNINGFLFSYEKVMQNKEKLVDSIISAIGSEKVSEQQKESALRFIEPNPTEYLNASRITRSIGNLGTVNATAVIGWGKYVHSNEPAIVELYVNKKLLKEMYANDFRQHLLDSGQHPTGCCGFYFDLTETPLKTGDSISVKVKDDVLDLKGSPYICNFEEDAS